MGKWSIEVSKNQHSIDMNSVKEYDGDFTYFGPLNMASGEHVPWPISSLRPLVIPTEPLSGVSWCQCRRILGQWCIKAQSYGVNELHWQISFRLRRMSQRWAEESSEASVIREKTIGKKRKEMYDCNGPYLYPPQRGTSTQDHVYVLVSSFLDNRC